MIIHLHVNRNTKEKGYALHGNSVFNLECFVITIAFNRSLGYFILFLLRVHYQVVT